MKRIFSALAVVGVAAMTLGAAGTANAEQAAVPQPVVIAQVAAGFHVKPQGQFVTIETPELQPVTLEQDLYVMATFENPNQAPVVLTTIPKDTTLIPGKPFVISDSLSPKPVPCSDLRTPFPFISPDAIWKSLSLTNVVIPRLVDKASVVDLSTLRPRQALIRESVADGTFTKTVRQPCEYIALHDLLPIA